MAADYAVSTGSIALSASATKSLWLLNPATNNAEIFEIDVSMDGSAPLTSVKIDLYFVVTLGAAAGATGTVNKVQATGTPAATTTALTALTTEPSTVTVLASWFVSPFGGLYSLQMPLGREPVLAGGGARWGLRAVTPTGVTPNIISNVWFEE